MFKNNYVSSILIWTKDNGSNIFKVKRKKYVSIILGITR